MTLAAIIKQSQIDREAWRYTDLERVIATLPLAPSPLAGEEEKTGTYLSAAKSKSLVFSGEGSASVDPSPAKTKDLLCKSKFSLPLRQGKRGLTARSHLNRLIFLNGLLQTTEALSLGVMSGNETDGYRLAITETAPSVLELLFLTDPTDELCEQTTLLHITLAPDSRLTLIERHAPATPDATSAFAHMFEITADLEQKAQLVHGKIVNNAGSAALVHLAETNVTVAQGACYDNFVLLRGGQLTRNAINVTLGETATCHLNGAMLLRGEDHADTTTRIVHTAPHAQSRQNYRSVLANKARGVFQGKTVVQEHAQKTDARQLCRALLLSHQAEMDAKPELEIYADDVKCSHGCAIGNIDDHALFYLRTRGIDEAKARALLIEAFISETTGDLHSPELRSAVQHEIEGWLHG